MVTYSSSESNSYASRPRERPGPALKLGPKSKTKKRKDNDNARSFYRLVANLANPDAGKGLPKNLGGSTPDLEQDLSSSWFLESGCQEKSAHFVALGTRWQAVEVNDAIVRIVLDKLKKATGVEVKKSQYLRSLSEEDGFSFFERPLKPVSRNGFLFSERELGALFSIISGELIRLLEDLGYGHMRGTSPVMKALDFHKTLAKLINENHRRPFVIFSKIGGNEHRLLVDRARLFWSHRLQMKSWQHSNGAEPLIRYFHAVLRSSAHPHEQLDILYWLKFDEGQRPLLGDYIDRFAPMRVAPEPLRLFCPRRFIEKLCHDSGRFLASASPKSGPIVEVLKLYVDAVSC